MLAATLEQAQLDKYVLGFVTRPGACRGEAIVTLANADAAVHCAQHFHGRRWDVSGIMVTAQLLTQEPESCKPVEDDGYAGCVSEDFLAVSDEDLLADPRLDDLHLLASYEARVDSEGGWDKHNLDTFGVDSCDHDDLVSQVFGSQVDSRLSAEAPEFIPGKMVPAVCEEQVGSDVSTEDGDALSSCDEKDGAVPKA